MSNINGKSIAFDGVEYFYNTFTTAEINEYKGLRDMYHGTGGFDTGSYLKQFPRETDTFYESRQSIAHYENIFKPELDSSVDAIFAKNQIRETNSEIIEIFTKNPSKINNESMPEYQRRKRIDLKLFGSVFEICDAPATEAESGLFDGSNDLMPYAFYLNPLQIEGYALDKSGALSMLIYFEDKDQRNADIHDISANDYRMKVWLRTSDKIYSFLYEEQKVIKESIKDDYEYFPVTLLEDNTRYKPNLICRSRYISELTVMKKIYNITSWFNDSFFKNCFAFLVVNGKLPPDIDLGNDGIMEYIGDGVNPPSYVAPPTEHLSVMITELERLIINLKQNMNSTVAIASTASGEARMEADRRRIEKLKQDAQDIQDNETWLVNYALSNYLDISYTYSVMYIKDFESLTKEDELSSLQSLLDTGYLKQPVIDEVVSDMLKITYSFNEKRAKELSELQINTIETTENDAFEEAPEIDE